MRHIMLINSHNVFINNLADLFFTPENQVVIFASTTPLSILEDYFTQHPKTLVVLGSGISHSDELTRLHTLIAFIARKHPIIGIGLGANALATYYGGQLITHHHRHGEALKLSHQHEAFLATMSMPLLVGCYHSTLCQLDQTSLVPLATYEDLPMAFYHQTAAICGFQFHPESLLTPEGARLMKETLHWIEAGINHAL